MKRNSWLAWATFGFLCLTSSLALGQGPTLPGGAAEDPRSTRSRLGPALGAAGGDESLGPSGALDEPISGRVGSSVPRVPASATIPSPARSGVPTQEGITAPSALPLAEVPLLGPLSVPEGRDDLGPVDGLTLDQAIDTLVRENLGLRSRAFELPQADADILTAGLRANPLLYADSQLVPYGSYSNKRPGGPIQYDVSITYPLDVSRKRKARVQVATRAKNVLQAQYQDAVRLQIDNLYTAYSDVLGARETIRFAQAAREGLAELLTRTKGLHARGTRTAADVSRIEALHEAAEIEVMDAEELLRGNKRNLGVLLNLRASQAEALELHGSLHDSFATPPAVDELIRLAMCNRPDVVAYRMGIERAEADVKLANANRMSDVYVLYQPYTFQDNSPFGKQSANSWALGVTVPLPVYNRNQGNIHRAKINVTQARVELAEREQVVENEVRQAERQYALTRAAIARIEGNLLPAARRVRDDAYRLYIQGEEDAMVYLNAQREFNEAARQYRDMLLRHRRSMLRVNTAVGQRLLP